MVITGRNTDVVIMLLGSVSLASHDRELETPRFEPEAFEMNLVLVSVIWELGTLSRNCEVFAAAQYRNKLGLMSFRTIEPDLMRNIPSLRSWVGLARVVRARRIVRH